MPVCILYYIMSGIDRDPMCSRMIRVSDDVHEMLCQAKLIPQEPYNNCLKRIIAENNYLKRHYLTEAPRESMYRDLKNFVLNQEIPDTICCEVNEAHVKIWNQTHPDDPLKDDELIHHINGDHNDNHPDNLKKIKKNEHGPYHKELNAQHSVNKMVNRKSDIAFGPKQE